MARIMVVDDEEAIRLPIKKLLENEGHEVTEAGSGLECLEMLLEDEKPDLILLDVMMPQMDGWEVSRKIREIPVWAEIKICMLTAKSSTLDSLMSLESAHADWHLNKPVSKKMLIDTVNMLLGS